MNDNLENKFRKTRFKPLMRNYLEEIHLNPEEQKKIMNRIMEDQTRMEEDPSLYYDPKARHLVPKKTNYQD